MGNAGPGDAAVTGTPAQAQAPGPVWRFLVRPRWLGWHLLMVACFWGMLWLGDWQFRRAMSGNALSWAYTFEWPLFAVFAVVFWAKTIRDEFRIRRGEMPDPRAVAAQAQGMPAGVAGTEQVTAGQLTVGQVRVGQVSVVQAAAADGDEDEELSAYNAYLARLNAEVKDHGRWHGLR